MAQQLTIDRLGAAALVTLNRPEKRNGLSVQLRLELAEAFAQLQADESVAAIGLTGAGAAFCAGLDVTEFGGDRANRELLVESAARCFQAIGHCTRPTVALINGPAVAGGFAFALLCDIGVLLDREPAGERALDVVVEVLVDLHVAIASPEM